jgi:hypothetical protein
MELHARAPLLTTHAADPVADWAAAAGEWRLAMQDDWPFDQPRICAVIALRSIMFGREPILHITHDADDHGWQFLRINTPDVQDAAVVSLQEVVERDGTLFEIGDLPPGWHAWGASKEGAWQRAIKDCE